MKFGDKLLQLRKKKGLSQEELGEQLDVTRQTVSKWELGQSKPDTDKLMEISKLLNVDFNQLADDEISIDDEVSSSNSETTKPRTWLLVLLIVIEIIFAIILINKLIIIQKEHNNNRNSWGIFDIFKPLMTEELEINKKAFNSKFEMQTGTQVGSFVSHLLDDIITNNKTNPNHIIEVVFDDITTNEPSKIKDLKNKIQSFSRFEVTADYNEDGYINKITIETSNENVLNEWNNSADSFNSKFEMHNGTSFGLMIKSLLDNVITSNKKNPSHIITISFNSTNTSDEKEIRDLKKELDDTNRYEVILDYDESGYVNKITIEK